MRRWNYVEIFKVFYNEYVASTIRKSYITEILVWYHLGNKRVILGNASHRKEPFQIKSASLRHLSAVS